MALEVSPKDGPAPLRASRGLHRAAMAQAESREHRRNRVALNNHAFQVHTVQAIQAQLVADGVLKPRLVPRTLRTIPLAEFLSAVAAHVATNGHDAVCR